MPWNEELTNLNYLFAALYPLVKDSIRLVDAAQLPKTHIAFDEKAINNWHAILSEAEKRGKVQSLIAAALQDYPEDPALQQAQRGGIRATRGPIIGQERPWQGSMNAPSFEKLMGKQSTLVPISFLKVGLERSRSVARVLRADGAFASGFLTEHNIFVTNHHVISSAVEAATSLIQFNYEQDATGNDLKAIELKLDPGRAFATSQEEDWTLVAVQGDANQDWGAIPIEPATIKAEERVNIIQHPAGGYKQLSYFHNIVAYADAQVVQYLTDTLPGSSGSPVFDSKWQLVALHHSGGWIAEPASMDLVYRNEGIHINRLVEGLKQLGLT